MIACGSYHVGMAAKHTWSGCCASTVEVTLASEFRYQTPSLPTNRCHQPVRRDGGHLAALREASAWEPGVLSIVNVVGSTIAREKRRRAHTCAGPRSPWPPPRPFQLAVYSSACAEALPWTRRGTTALCPSCC